MHEDESRLGGQVRAKQVLFPSLSGHQSTRDALDLIFSAIPALKMLRDTLAASAPSRGPSANKSRSSGSLKIISNPTATRPAAAWAEAVGLGTVSEATEWGSDDGEDRKARRRSRGCVISKSLISKLISVIRRRSGVGSVAASRSPLPFITRDRIPRDSLSALVILETGSPRSSASPSPHKQALGVPRSPHTEKKQKRRRESGLLRPRSRSATPETAEAGVLSDRVEVLTVPHIFEVSPPEGESIGSEQSTRHVRVKNIAGMLDPAQRVGTDALQLSNSEDSRIRSTKGTKRNIVREEPGLEGDFLALSVSELTLDLRCPYVSAIILAASRTLPCPIGICFHRRRPRPRPPLKEERELQGA